MSGCLWEDVICWNVDRGTMKIRFRCVCFLPSWAWPLRMTFIAKCPKAAVQRSTKNLQQ